MNYRSQIEAVLAKRCPSRVVNKNGKPFPYPWKYLDSRKIKTGVQLAFEVPIGYSVNDIKQETDSLSASCGREIEIENRAGAVIISVLENEFDPMIPFKPEMLELSKGRSILCGFDRMEAPVIHSFKVPHLLVAGMSGYGKTDFLRLLVYQLIHRFGDRIAIDIIDGKGFSFLPFRGIPNIRIVRDLDSAASIISSGKEEMLRRSDIVWKSSNRKVTQEFQWRLIIIDELAQFAPANQVTNERKKVAQRAYAEMAAIACVGREAGVGLIMGTQRPDANTIHPSVKANCEASIAFRTKTLTNSEIIIDRGGAEKLPQGRAGRGIYSGTIDRTFQVPYVGDDDAWYDLLDPFVTEEVKRDAEQQEQGEASADNDFDWDAKDFID